MSGVYNRKLFRQSGARDELRRMGGIMSSSEELMREALMTGMQAPGPSDLGPMPMPQQPMGMPPPPVMQQQPMNMGMQQQPMDMGMQQQPMDMGMQQQPMNMGMQQQPMDMGMQQQPMDMGMQQQPMDMGMQQQPMDMGMQQSPMDMGMQQSPMDMGMQSPMDDSAYMSPQMPQSLPPAGFAGGGFVPYLPNLPPETSAAEPVDIGQTAGTVVAPPKITAIGLDALVERIGPQIDTASPEEIGNDIVGSLVDEPTGDLQLDLAKTLEQLTGDPAAYEKNIDDLNRGIIGAAIAAGTSARATQNIANGMLVGLESAKATEERRVGDSRALQLAQLQARAAGAKGGKDSASRDYRNPVDAYQDAYQAVMNAGEMDLEIPEGMSREDYADQVATDLIRRSYTPDQLVGGPFEGLSAPAAPAGPAADVNVEDVLDQARKAIEAGRDPVGVAEKLKSMGIDPGLL